MLPTPRQALSLSLAFAALCAAFTAGSTFAAAPQVKTQAPGYYRVLVSSLSTGSCTVPSDSAVTSKSPSITR